MKFMNEIKEALKDIENGSAGGKAHSNQAHPSQTPPAPAQNVHHRNGYQPTYVQPVPQQQAPLKQNGSEWPVPKLSVRVVDLNDPGAIEFFKSFHPTELMKEAVMAVFTHLYTPKTCPNHVESVTLVIEDIKGVAHTFGLKQNNNQKEIHLSTQHILKSKNRLRDEIRGVLVHEMTHCFQYNAKGTCPGGLIEGFADFVRLRAQLAPPHWRRGGERWDEGYQTTGFFLDWIDGQHGDGTVRKLNGCLRDQQFKKEIFF